MAWDESRFTEALPHVPLRPRRPDSLRGYGGVWTSPVTREFTEWDCIRFVASIAAVPPRGGTLFGGGGDQGYPTMMLGCDRENGGRVPLGLAPFS